MALATAAAIDGVEEHSFALFLASFMVAFLCAGAGNGSTYRMIPSIYAALGRRAPRRVLEFKRQAAGAIGIAGAIGALGGFFIQLALRQASLPVVQAMTAAAKHIRTRGELAATMAKVATTHATWSVPALWAFLAGYLLLAGLTWFCYLRASILTQRFPTLAADCI